MYTSKKHTKKTQQTLKKPRWGTGMQNLR